jgi:3-oxoacyl-[acyl-carrier protein] reductase
LQNLKDRTVIITGGSKGIGRVLALKLASEGANIVVTGRTEKDLLKMKVELLKQNPSIKIISIPSDVSVYDDVKSLVRQVVSEFGHIHYLINNAALLTHKPISEFGVDEWKKVIDVNLNGPFMMCREVIPHMEKLSKTTGGTIINIASTSGKRGYERGTAYSSSKFAMRGLSESLFKEVRNSNIRVVTIFPSYVDTKISEESKLKNIGKGVNLRVEDVADSIIYTMKLPQRAMIKELEIWCTNP